MDKRIEELRERLIKIAAGEPSSYGQLAREIGIDTATLSKFIRSKTSPHFKVLGKMERYVSLKEMQQRRNAEFDF